MPRVAVVAGASGGIGRAIASRLEDHGYSVVRLSRSLEEVCSETTLTLKCDATCRDSVLATIAKVVTHFGRIDLFINSVGIAQAKHIANLTEEDMGNLYTTNVITALWLYQAAVAQMKRQGSGYIIHIGSLRSEVPGLGKGAYCATKAATTQLTKVLAKECRAFGIRVTTIHPGYVNTKLYKSVSQKIPFRSVLKNGKMTMDYFAEVVEVEDIGKMVVCLDSLSERVCIDEIRMGRVWGS